MRKEDTRRKDAPVPGTYKYFHEFTSADILQCMHSFYFHVIDFIYKGTAYEFTGYWALFDDDNDRELASYGAKDKEKFFTDPIFDGGTKTFLDIVDEIELKCLDLDPGGEYPRF